MTKIIRRISILILLSTFFFTNGYSQPMCNIDSIYISPSNPDDQTPIKLFLHVDLWASYCNPNMIPTGQIVQTGNDFKINRRFCSNGWTSSCVNIDTFSLGILPIGNYTITNLIYTEFCFLSNPGPWGSCSYPTVQFTVSTFTGIKETNIPRFKICPNPSNGKIRISELDYLKDGIISLIDMEGRIIFQKPWNPLENVFDFGDLKQGIYFLNINSIDGINSTEKLIIMN